MTTTSPKERLKKKAVGGHTVNVLNAPRTRELLDQIAAAFAGIPATPVLGEQEFFAELRQILADAHRRGGLRQEMEDRLAAIGYRLPLSFFKRATPARGRGRGRDRQELPTSDSEGLISAVPSNAFAGLSGRNPSRASQRLRAISADPPPVMRPRESDSDPDGSNPSF